MTLTKKNNREGTDDVSNLRQTRASGSGQDDMDVFLPALSGEYN